MKIVLHVPHRGVPKMVGKIFPLVAGADAFLHEERSGDQRHFVTDSPGGIDVCVIAALLAYKVRLVYHGNQGRDLLVAPVARLVSLGNRRREDGRHRVFLPTPAWDATDVTFKNPWIPDSSIVVLREDDDWLAAEPEPPARPPSPSPSKLAEPKMTEQFALFSPETGRTPKRYH